MIILEYDYLAFLSHQKKDITAISTSIISSNKDLYSIVPNTNNDSFINAHSNKIFRLNSKIDFIHLDFPKIAKELLQIIKTNEVKEITFYTFPMLLGYMITDLINLEVKFKILSHSPESFLPNSNVSAVLPFAYEHAREYVSRFKMLMDDQDFYYYVENTISISDEFYFFKNGEISNEFPLDFTKTDSCYDLICNSGFNDNECPMGALGDQDVSLHLYYPPLKQGDSFYLKKSFYNTLNSEDLKLLKEDVNYFIYLKTVNVGTHLSDEKSELQELVPSEFEEFDSLEKEIFYHSRQLYLESLGDKR